MDESTTRFYRSLSVNKPAIDSWLGSAMDILDMAAVQLSGSINMEPQDA